MVKKTLFAIALALLVTTANAGIVVTNLSSGPPGDVSSASVKVEGSEKWEKTFNWPYWVNWGYEAQDICTIPVKMEVGMYIEIIDCNRKEIVLKQVSCADIGKNADQYPCYKKCINVDAVSNFDAKLGLNRTTSSPILNHDKWKAEFVGGDTVPKDGNVHTLEICVEAWEAKIYKHEPGSKVSVGSVTITVKPQ